MEQKAKEKLGKTCNSFGLCIVMFGNFTVLSIFCSILGIMIAEDLATKSALSLILLIWGVLIINTSFFSYLYFKSIEELNKK